MRASGRKSAAASRNSRRDVADMSRNPDPLDHLADALSEDILAAPAEQVLAEATEDAGDDRADAAAFDRVAARAARQSRRRRLAAHIRALAAALVPQRSWRPVLATIAGLAVIVVAGDLYLHVRPEAPLVAQDPSQPPRAPPASARVAPSEPASNAMPQVAANSAPEGARDATMSEHLMRLRKELSADAPSPAGPPAPAARSAPPAGAARAPPEVKAAREPRQAFAPTAGAIAPGGAPPALSKREQGGAQDRLRALLAEVQGRADADEKVAKRKSSSSALVSSSVAGLQQPVAGPPAFDWPLRGNLRGGFGSVASGASNTGIDLAAPPGSAVRAAADGDVVYAGDLAGYGNTILLRHRDGFVTVYAHAGTLLVKRNDRVGRGQAIAKSGGDAGASPLHFEIRKDAAPVDPAQFLPPG